MPFNLTLTRSADVSLKLEKKKDSRQTRSFFIIQLHYNTSCYFHRDHAPLVSFTGSRHTQKKPFISPTICWQKNLFLLLQIRIFRVSLPSHVYFLPFSLPPIPTPQTDLFIKDCHQRDFSKGSYSILLGFIGLINVFLPLYFIQKLFMA